MPMASSACKCHMLHIRRMHCLVAAIKLHNPSLGWQEALDRHADDAATTMRALDRVPEILTYDSPNFSLMFSMKGDMMSRQRVSYWLVRSVGAPEQRAAAAATHAQGHSLMQNGGWYGYGQADRAQHIRMSLLNRQSWVALSNRR